MFVYVGLFLFALSFCLLVGNRWRDLVDEWTRAYLLLPWFEDDDDKEVMEDGAAGAAGRLRWRFFDDDNAADNTRVAEDGSE